MRTKFLHIFLLTSFLIFLTGIIPAAAKEKPVTVSLSSATLRQIARDALPLPLATQNQYFEGDVIIDSLDYLQLNEKSIFLQGVVSSRNLAIKTDLGGQDMTIKLGNLRLPISCELALRFDGKKKILFVTPHFSKYDKMKSTGSADLFLPLLSALGNKEYPVEVQDLQPFLTRVKTPDISKMEPTDIQTKKDMLVLKMQPKKK